MGAGRALPAIASLAAVCLVGALVSSSEPVATVLIAAGALCGAAVFVEALRRGRALAARGAQIAALQHTLARQETEATRLSAVVLPEAIERLRRGEVAEEVLTSLGGRAGHGNRWGNDAALTPRFRAALQAVLAHVIDAVDNEESLRDSAQRAFVNVARRVQAIVHQQAHEMREM
ncbi:ATPase, partial [Streptomyces sp. WM6349]